MSWSVGATGRAAALIPVLEGQFAGYQCAEPEEGVRQAAKGVILSALKAQSPQVPVKVLACGSQSQTGQPGAPGALLTTNNLSITIEPIHGFIENSEQA